MRQAWLAPGLQPWTAAIVLVTLRCKGRRWRRLHGAAGSSRGAPGLQPDVAHACAARSPAAPTHSLCLVPCHPAALTPCASSHVTLLPAPPSAHPPNPLSSGYIPMTIWLTEWRGKYRR